MRLLRSRHAYPTDSSQCMEYGVYHTSIGNLIKSVNVNSGRIETEVYDLWIVGIPMLPQHQVACPV